MADGTTLEDGVLVTRSTEPLANGELALRVSVPIVTASRVDTYGDPATANIQLGKNYVGLPIGFGVVSITGDAKPLSASAAAIKAAVDAVPIVHSKAENAYLSNYTQKYLSTLSATDSVQVQTITPITDAFAPVDRLSIGSISNHDAQVIDASLMAVGSTVLSYAQFIVVLGTASVDMAINNHFVIGDDASQIFGEVSRGGTVYAGGGNDTLITGFGLARIDTLFHGGKGYDVLDVGSGSIEQHAGYVLVKGGHEVTMKLINVEQIKMIDQIIDITATTAQKAIATLYQNILGRQADLDGFGYWDNQVKAGQSLGQVAITMTRSTESGNTLFNGQTSHDLDTLYNVILHRATDPVGKAYWSAQIDQGHQTLEQVAQGFVTSNELVNAYLQQNQWDFLV